MVGTNKGPPSVQQRLWLKTEVHLLAWFEILNMRKFMLLVLQSVSVFLLLCRVKFMNYNHKALFFNIPTFYKNGRRIITSASCLFFQDHSVSALIYLITHWVTLSSTRISSITWYLTLFSQCSPQLRGHYIGEW